MRNAITNYIIRRQDTFFKYTQMVNDSHELCVRALSNGDYMIWTCVSYLECLVDILEGN